MDIQNNGIAVIDNAYSVDYCMTLIKYFNWCQANYKTWGRTESAEMYKKDESCLLDDMSIQYSMGNCELMGEFNKTFFDTHYKNYTNYFSVLNEVSKHGIIGYKIQKTLPGGGYHIWHCETDNSDRARRLGTYILYLNDVEEGGETEFLYQQQRVAPKTGRLVIFPAGYTHAHRGNPPLKGEKYIMTGWLEFM